MPTKKKKTPKESHIYELVTVHATGWEEHYCPRCARRILVRTPPENRKVILDAGDIHARHFFDPAGLADDRDLELYYLAPYIEYMTERKKGAGRSRNDLT